MENVEKTSPNVHRCQKTGDEAAEEPAGGEGERQNLRKKISEGGKNRQEEKETDQEEEEKLD